MASYGYQYGTSPRKLEPEVTSPKKSPKKVSSTKAQNKAKSKNYQDKIKKQEIKVAKKNFAIVMVVGLGCILLLMYRNVKIRESFAGVQSLSKSVSSLEKENSQILVNIQNNLNLNNIENVAASTLGMQKLSSKQTVYINLDAKNYTEISQKSITKPNKTSLVKKIIDKIVDFF